MTVITFFLLVLSLSFSLSQSISISIFRYSLTIIITTRLDCWCYHRFAPSLIVSQTYDRSRRSDLSHDFFFYRARFARSLDHRCIVARDRGNNWGYELRENTIGFRDSCQFSQFFSHDLITFLHCQIIRSSDDVFLNSYHHN